MPKGTHRDGGANKGGGAPVRRSVTRGVGTRALKAQNDENTSDPRHNAAVVAGRAIQAQIAARQQQQRRT